MVMINWLIQLAVLKNVSHNFFKLKGGSVCSLITLFDDNENITREHWGRDTNCIHFRFIGRLTLIEDLVVPYNKIKLWG